MPRTEQHQITLTDEEYALAVERYKLCLDLICALPGCPTVYYGDEAGMTGCSDPFCRRPFPWGHEDKELQAYVREKLRARRDDPLLRTGFCEVDTPDDNTLVIRRFMLDGRDALGDRTDVSDIQTIFIRR